MTNDTPDNAKAHADESAPEQTSHDSIETTVGETDDSQSNTPPGIVDKDLDELTEEDIEHLDPTTRELLLEGPSYQPDEDDDAPVEETPDDDPERPESERELPTPDEVSSSGLQSSEDTSNDAPDEIEPEEQGTLQETDLVNDENLFEWETDESDESWGEASQDRFEYKDVPFELQEPDDPHAYENAAKHLEGIQEMDEGRRKAAFLRFSRQAAEICLTIQGVPITEVYMKDGKPVRETDETDYENDPDATPFWDAGTWYDQRLLGSRVDRFMSGEDRFRER